MTDRAMAQTLDVRYARSNFPAFTEQSLHGWSFFENAGGSYACGQTIAALEKYYRQNKVQPYGFNPASQAAGEAMDRSHRRWAAALGVDETEVHFGPSTSMNTYVLGSAFASILEAGDEVVVTNQDHEANTGAIRRAALTAGASLVEWRVDPDTGLLDPEILGSLLTNRTKLVTFPHASNIIGQENDVQHLSAMAHEAGARVIVDGVAFAPHGFPDLAALNPDVYLFSLYKTYSVHQGLMVVRNGLIDELPNQGHYFNAAVPGKRLTPAGPDHAQEAAAGAVIDYIEALARHHDPDLTGLRAAARLAAELWQQHETRLLGTVLDVLRSLPGCRILGSDKPESGTAMHRCPTVSFVPGNLDPAQVAMDLSAHQVMAGAGHFYARRLIEAAGIDPDRGVVRLSFVHYTDDADIERLIGALEAVCG